MICSTCEIIFTPTPIVSSRSEQWTFRHFTERKYLLKHGGQGGVRDTVVVKGKHSMCHVHLWPELTTTSLPWANFRLWRSKCTTKHAFALSTQFPLGTPDTSFPTCHWSYFICSCRSISFSSNQCSKGRLSGSLGRQLSVRGNTCMRQGQLQSA